MPAANPDLNKAWTEKLAEWRTSGLSGAKWCRQQGIKYHTFLYWLKKSRWDNSIPAKPFIEIVDKVVNPGFQLEVQGVTIRLSCQFDAKTLRSCLQILKSLPC